MSRSDSEAAGLWKEWVAGPDANGRRLDQWLSESLGAEASRNRVQQLIRAGAVSVNGAPALETKLKLAEGDRVALAATEPVDAVPCPEPIPIAVLHEDSELIVIAKPAGLVVHPGPGNWSGTLVNALLHHCGASLSGIGGVKRPGIVHRLDKETSGVMVVAKTDRAHRALAEAFADHGRSGDLERAYQALVWGAPERSGGTVDAPLGRDSVDRTRRAVVREDREDARRAVTHFTVLERFAVAGETAAALLECRLETGRAHQIRVHLAHIGNPVIGDPEYGRGFRTKANRLPEPLRTAAATFPRQALHAAMLGFRHPTTGQKMRFEAPLPADMAELIRLFRV